MYTLIIADDEENLRRMIADSVNWEEIGFKLIGEAENGARALELVEQLEPDLLLTDIKMPFISGIELARQVREVRPVTHIAFLSGHDDFSYAQQAIQYNIISYMLKPISLSELTGNMIEIKNKMDIKNEEFKKRSISYSNNLSEFLMPVILDSSIPNDLIEYKSRAVEYGLLKDTEDTPKFYVIAVKLEDSQGNTVNSREYVHSVDSILKKYVRYGSFYANDKIVSLIAENSWELSHYLHIIVDEIAQSFLKAFGVKCFVGVSREKADLAGCHMAYNEAASALSYSAEKINPVSYIDDIEKPIGVSYEIVLKRISKLENIIKSGSETEISLFFDELFLEFSSSRVSSNDLSFISMELVSSVTKTIGTVLDGEKLSEFFDECNIFTVFDKNASLNQIKTQAINFCSKARFLISNQRKQSFEILCDNAVEIINSDFNDENLSLVSLSERLHVSSNYLSALIKKVKGDTFINLLTEKRMTEAYNLLLSSTLRIIEIAEKCGYSDQHYFSYCFKKKFGLSPNKFREEIKERENA